MVFFYCLLLALALRVLLITKLNELHYVGPVYWITRDIGNDKTPFLSKAFMRQTSSPWKVGTGVQLCVGKYTLQVGLCKANPHEREDEGLLHALQGRYVENDIDDIRKWK